MDCTRIIHIAGVTFIILIVIRIIRILKRNLVYFRPCQFDFNLYARDDAYALITGGAGGIGKACAKQFAKRGINLVLVDLKTSLLDETVAELKKVNPNVKIKAVAFDLTTLTSENGFNEFKSSLTGIKIGILFNNAGIAEYKAYRFTEESRNEINMICEINAIVPTLLCKMLLPQMLERKCGLVMTMSSASAMCPCSILPVYGSTKSFVYQLSQSLQNAYPTRESGLVFHAFHPQFVQSAMTLDGPAKVPIKTALAKRFIFPDADAWIESALKTVGRHGGASSGWLWFELAIFLQPYVEKYGVHFGGGLKAKIIAEARAKQK